MLVLLSFPVQQHLQNKMPEWSVLLPTFPIHYQTISIHYPKGLHIPQKHEWQRIVLIEQNTIVKSNYNLPGS